MSRHAKGTNRDSFDSRDLVYRPALVDLPPSRLPDWSAIRVLDQGEEGACTGFGLAATINYLLHLRRRAHGGRGPREQVSARMLYTLAKRYDQWPGNQYDWSSARGAMKAWYKHGVCPARDWPNGNAADTELTLDRQQAALQVPLGAYYRVLPRRTDAQAALTEVGVLFAACATHAGWDAPKDGVIGHDRDAPEDLGHAFAILGYTDRGLLVQNSWGPRWGGIEIDGKRRGGFAIWTYEDFERHAWDLWVARLARPVESLEALRSEYTDSPRGSRRTQSGPPPLEVSRHLIHIDDGQFDTGSEYSTSLASATELIRGKVAAAQARGELRLLMHAHGGLNTVDEVARRCRRWRDVIDANRVEHFHWLWETGLLAELKDVILGKDKFADERAGGPGDWKDKLIEASAGLVATPVWREMKTDASGAFTAQGAGSQVLAAFGQELARVGGIPKVHITLSGHSAGAIWVGETLEAWQRLEPNFKVDEVFLMAPACRVDFFQQKIVPHVLAGRVGHLTVLQLSDQAERDDRVAVVYGKSLLYFVSNACESGGGKAPLLGLQVFNGGWSADRQALGPRLTLVTAEEDPTRSRARDHSGFDNDVTTMNFLLTRALGGLAPQRPFTADELED